MSTKNSQEINPSEKPIFLQDDYGIYWSDGAKQYCLHVKSNPTIDEFVCPWDVKLACWHSHYALGNQKQYEDACEFWRALAGEAANMVPSLSDEAIRTWFLNIQIGHEPDLSVENYQNMLSKYLVWLPIWMYDHSGVSLTAAEKNPYGDPFDSMPLGYAAIWKKDLGIGDNRTDWKDVGYSILKSVVNQYANYLNGDIFSFCLLEKADTSWEPVECELLDGYETYADDLNETVVLSLLPGDIGQSLEKALNEGTYTEHLISKHTHTITVYDYEP